MDEQNTTAVVTAPEQKSITDLSISDVKLNIDHDESYDRQAEEIVNAMATAKAVEDSRVAKELTEHKAEELTSKAEARAKAAEQQKLNAEIAKQTSESQLYESVLQTFGITKHLPNWLMKIMVFILSPIYILLTLVIGVPFGIVKTIIDNIDNVLVRYEKVDENIKPHLKFTVWIILILAVAAGAALCLLKFFGKL